VLRLRGKVDACRDSAAMDLFYSLLQNVVLDRQRCSTREGLGLAIVI